MSKCQVKRCKNEVYIIFYSHPVCEKCWSRHCDVPFLKEYFKIKETHSDEILIDKQGEVKVFDDWKTYFNNGV